MVLLLSLIDGQEEKQEFIDIYNKYKSGVYYIALSRLHKHELAEECVQEVFLSVAKNFKQFNSCDEERLKGIIFTVTKYKAIDLFKKESKQNRESLGAVCDLDEQDFEGFDLSELKMAIDSLPEEIRYALELKFAYGFKVREIASMISISESTVKKRVNKGLSLLREILEEKND